MADPSPITRNLIEALWAARPYVLAAVKAGDHDGSPQPIRDQRARVLEQIDGTLADAGETL